jgi:hypothetical protein
MRVQCDGIVSRCHEQHLRACRCSTQMHAINLAAFADHNSLADTSPPGIASGKLTEQHRPAGIAQPDSLADTNPIRVRITQTFRLLSPDEWT